MKLFRYMLFFSLFLVCICAIAQQPLPRNGEIVELRKDECAVVRVGAMIHFHFKMKFDQPLPTEARTNAYVTFLKPSLDQGMYGQNRLPIQGGITRAGEPDEWDYVGTIGQFAYSGEYQMTDLAATFDVGMGPNGSVTAGAQLSPEARQEIGKYHVCLKDGYVPKPVPKGVITDVSRPTSN